MKRAGLCISLSMAISVSGMVPVHAVMASFNTDLATTSKPDDEINELDVWGINDAISLHNLRTVCMNGLGAELRRRQLARDNSFPEVHSLCLSAEKASIRGSSWRRVFASLVLQDLHGPTTAQTVNDLDSVNSEQIKLIMLSLVKAAKSGNATFTGISGSTYSYRPELALITGLAHGVSNRAEIVLISDAAELEAAIRACFAPNPLKTITVTGVVLPSRRACLLAGAVIGKRLAQNPRTLRG